MSRICRYPSSQLESVLGAKTICGKFIVDLCRFALNENLFVNGSSRTYPPDFRRVVREPCSCMATDTVPVHCKKGNDCISAYLFRMTRPHLLQP